MRFPVDSWQAVEAGTVRRLVGAELASLVGDFMVIAAMPFAVIELGGSAGVIGVVLAAQGFGLVAALPLGGVIGDRWDRRQIMVTADVFRLCSQGVIAALLLTGSATMWQLVAAQLVHGFASGLFMPASNAIVPDVVARKDIQATNGLKALTRAVAGSGGPILGAAAAAVAGPGSAMVVDAATFGLSAVLLTGVRSAGAPRVVKPWGTPRRSSLIGEFREGWTEFLRWEWLRAITAEFAVVNAAAIAPFYVLGPLAAEGAYSGVAAWALILGFLAAGRFVGGALASSWRPRRPLVSATVVFLAWTVPLVFLAATLPLAVVLCGVFIAGLGDAGFSVIWETATQKSIPSASRARLASVEALGSLVFVPVGFLIAGWLEPVIGMATTLLFGAATVGVATAVTLRTPGVRQMRSEPGKHGPQADNPGGGVDDLTRQAA